jgi:hypothetical protein
MVLFSGIFTLVPLEEVSVIVFTSTTKERRFVKLVFGGGLSGVALHVTLTVAVPPPPTGGGEFFRAPLQEIKEMADSNSSETKTFRKFMQPPWRNGCRAKGGQGHQRTKNDFIGCLRRINVKRELIAQLLKWEPGFDHPRR